MSVGKTVKSCSGIILNVNKKIILKKIEKKSIYLKIEKI